MIGLFRFVGRLRLASQLLCALCLCAALLVTTGRAFAHASLIRAEPADGSVMEKAPSAFALTFNEPTSPIVLKLVRPGGGNILLDRYTLRDATLEIEAPADLSDGTYVLSWRVISEDGHPVGGSTVFSVGAPSAGAVPSAAETIDWPVRTAIWFSRLVLYAGLFMGVGGAFFMNWVGGRGGLASRAARWTIVAGMAAAVLSIGLQGLDALGVSLANIVLPAAWVTGVSTTFGITALLALAGLVAGFISLSVGATPARTLSMIAFCAVGAALAASGHASAAHPQWLTRPAVFLHGIGIAFWAGSLIPLAAALASPLPDDRTLLSRFSSTIPFAVLPLVVAGILLAVIQLASLTALWTTAYGLVLLMKIALLIGLFLLAILNRFALTKPAIEGDVRATRRLRRSIQIEIALVLAIFAVAGLWRFTPPPRALAEAAAAPASVHIHTSKAMAEVTIAPGHAGPVSASIMVMSGDFSPLDAKEVMLVLSNESAGIEQIKRAATKSSDGLWHVNELNLPVPGEWTARVEILVSDFDIVKIEDKVDIRP